MSIYNAIARQGRNTGAGLNAFAQGKYMVDQQNQQNALAAEERQQQNALAAEERQQQMNEKQVGFIRELRADMENTPPPAREARLQMWAGDAQRLGFALEPNILEMINEAIPYSGVQAGKYGKDAIPGIDAEGNPVFFQASETGNINILQDVRPPGPKPKEVAQTRKEEAQATQAEQDAQLNLTPAEKAVDAAFAKDYNDLIAQGGIADIEKQQAQLQDVHKQLLDISEGRSSANLTGPWLSMVPKGMRARINPASVAAQDAVEEVVQRNLRLILGAQFTEKEGTRLIERAYNPALDEPENAKRLLRLMNQITDAAKAKMEAAAYYEENGTLKGYKGKTTFSASDFLNSGPEPTGRTATNPDTGEKVIEMSDGSWISE